MSEENMTIETVGAEAMNPPESSKQESPAEEVRPEEAKVDNPVAEDPNPAEEKKPKDAKIYSFEDLKKKLEKEKAEAKDKEFVEPVAEHLLERCKEDNGLVQDIMQEHKTWKKCMDYINAQAKKKLNNHSGPVKDSVVYEWAEDYYRKDDKAEEIEKAKEEAERKKQAEARSAKQKEKQKAGKKLAKKEPEKKASVEVKPASKPETKAKKKDEIEGQMDFFSMLG